MATQDAGRGQGRARGVPDIQFGEDWFMKSRGSVLLFAVVCFSIATTLAQSNAKALFQSGNPEINVGIQYWLQTADGRRLTERMAASVTGPLTLHVRSNIGGFLAVWTTVDGHMLTPGYEGFAGHLIQANDTYDVGGGFRIATSENDGRVVILFARSQTEQVRRVEDAMRKLSRLLPSTTKQSDEAPGAIGTYVVNREGNQPGVEISITR